MKLYILSSSSAIISARILSEEIELITNISCIATTRSDYIKGDFIRFGNTDAVDPKYKDLGINTQDFISLCHSKLRFSILMRKKDLYSPIFNREKEPDKFPVMIRKTLYGKGGEGIVIVEDVNEFQKNWNNNYFWTPYIPTEFEVRVHIAGGKILRIFKKIWGGNGEEGKYPVRNMEKGYRFSLRLEPEKEYPKIYKLVEQISEIPIFKDQMYALDLGWDKEEKRYFIFEGNSCMGMSNNTASFYAQYLVEKLNLEKKENG